MKLNQPTKKELINISKKHITTIKKKEGVFGHNSKYIPDTNKAYTY